MSGDVDGGRTLGGKDKDDKVFLSHVHFTSFHLPNKSFPMTSICLRCLHFFEISQLYRFLPSELPPSKFPSKRLHKLLATYRTPTYPRPSGVPFGEDECHFLPFHEPKRQGFEAACSSGSKKNDAEQEERGLLRWKNE